MRESYAEETGVNAVNDLLQWMKLLSVSIHWSIQDSNDYLTFMYPITINYCVTLFNEASLHFAFMIRLEIQGGSNLCTVSYSRLLSIGTN